MERKANAKSSHILATILFIWRELSCFFSALVDIISFAMKEN